MGENGRHRHPATAEYRMGKTRVEKDTFGPIEVAAERLWGAQTQRSLEHFRISGERIPVEVIRALALVKRACATVNESLGKLAPEKARAIAQAADEVLEGKWRSEERRVGKEGRAR